MVEAVELVCAHHCGPWPPPRLICLCSGDGKLRLRAKKGVQSPSPEGEVGWQRVVAWGLES